MQAKLHHQNPLMQRIHEKRAPFSGPTMMETLWAVTANDRGTRSIRSIRQIRMHQRGKAVMSKVTEGDIRSIVVGLRLRRVCGSQNEWITNRIPWFVKHVITWRDMHNYQVEPERDRMLKLPVTWVKSGKGYLS